MANRHGERIRCICTSKLYAGEQDFEHRLNLRLLRTASADDRFLDQPRCIFSDPQPTARRNEEANPARLTKFERRLGIRVDKNFFHRRISRLVLQNDITQRRIERHQSFSECGFGVGCDLPIGDVGQPVALCGDDPPAGCAKAGIKTEDKAQESFSITSSDTS